MNKDLHWDDKHLFVSYRLANRIVYVLGAVDTELEQLRAKVARVEALTECWTAVPRADLLAALADPAPTHQEDKMSDTDPERVRRETDNLIEFLTQRIAEDEKMLPLLLDPLEFIDNSFTTRWGERVLADCEAKRRIVEAAATGFYDSDLDVALAHLASVYADHPDYRDEWKP